MASKKTPKKTEPEDEHRELDWLPKTEPLPARNVDHLPKIKKEDRT